MFNLLEKIMKVVQLAMAAAGENIIYSLLQNYMAEWF
jgi:hypothetical protein